MPVAPRLRPVVTLHYKIRIRRGVTSVWHNSYVFKEKKHRTDTNRTAQPHTIARDLKIQIKLLEELWSMQRKQMTSNRMNVVVL